MQVFVRSEGGYDVFQCIKGKVTALGTQRALGICLVNGSDDSKDVWMAQSTVM